MRAPTLARHMLLIAVVLSLPAGVVLGKKTFQMSGQVLGYWACDYGFGMNTQSRRCAAEEDPETLEIISWLHLPKAVLNYPFLMVARWIGSTAETVQDYGMLVLVLAAGALTARYAAPPLFTAKAEVLLVSLALYTVPAWFMNGRMLFAFIGIALLFNLASLGRPGWVAALLGILAIVLCSVSSGGVLVGATLLALVLYQRPALRRWLAGTMVIGAALLILAIGKLWIFYSETREAFVLDLLGHGYLDNNALAAFFIAALAVAVVLSVRLGHLPRLARKIQELPIHVSSLFAITLLSPLGGGVASLLLPGVVAEVCRRYAKWLSGEGILRA